MEIVIHDTPEQVADATAAMVAAALAEPGAATLALAGGSTPRETHRALQTASVDWDQVTMWLADERWVPAGHEDSNATMARQTLVDPVGGRLVVPEHGDDPHAAADAYARTLDAIWVERDGRRRPDVVMLGIGDDGHTASLFPDTTALEDTSNTYVANWVAAKNTWRLTATFPLLWSARRIVFLVTGGGKADVLRRILDDGEPFPARRVASGAEGEVTWMLDAAAASQLARPH